MLDVKVEVNAEDVQRQVVQAIIDSAIGEALKKSLEELAKEWKVAGYWDNSLTKTIKQEAEALLRQETIKRVKPIIVAKVESLITDDFVEAIVRKGWESIRWGY